MLNIISGLLKPDSGEIRRGGRVAHIHQELMIFPHLSVEENIVIGTKGVSAAPLLAEFAREDIDLRSRAGSLSLADRQVIEICRALAVNADVILMDEPTSSLQRSDVDRLFAVIRRLRERGIAIIYVSHFLEEVREIADRFTVLRDGRSVLSGALGEVSDEERDEWFARCTRDRHAGEHVVDEEIGEARAKGHCDLYRHVYARVAVTANVEVNFRLL